MRIPRVYHPFPLGIGTETELSPAAAQHVGKVLRLREGAALILFDGQGNACEANVVSVDKRGVRVNMHAPLIEHTESPLHTHLGLGISKGERMDYAIQKAVEAGVSEITPLLTEHTVVRLDAKRRASRQQHWQGVIISACEQCGRNRLPELHDVTTLADWVVLQQAAHKLVFDADGNSSLRDINPPPREVTILIGPEGGLGQEEIRLATQERFKHVRLGPRTLRTETAAVAIIASLQTLWGDYA